MAADVALALDGVTVTFGGLTAVRSVSMAVPRGERRAVIGPNGAGKTTLFRTVSGEQRPTRGSVRLFGRDVTRLPPHRRARLGLGRTYQVTNVFPDLTVEENVALALLSGRPARLRPWWPLSFSGPVAEGITASLEDMHLVHRRADPAKELSHGEQRQLELCLALATSPEVLLLDEPAAGLSMAERGLLSTLIADLPASLTLLLIEHDVELAFSIADHVVCMDEGVVIDEGTPDAIRASEAVQAVYLKVD